MKVRIYTLDLELSARSKRRLLVGLACLVVLGGGAVLAAPAHVWTDGETLKAKDLNDSFVALQASIDALKPRRLTRAHGNGPNENLTNGAIPSRKLAITKGRDDTGLRIVWMDNTRCLASATPNGGSCVWEIKIDGSSCTMPGPLVFHRYVGVENLLIAGSYVVTCFGVPAGPHVLQVYVSAPVGATGTGGATPAGVAWTGWNEAYWMIETEEVL